jgi:hypothetical protein
VRLAQPPQVALPLVWHVLQTNMQGMGHRLVLPVPEGATLVRMRLTASRAPLDNTLRLTRSTSVLPALRVAARAPAPQSAVRAKPDTRKSRKALAQHARRESMRRQETRSVHHVEMERYRLCQRRQVARSVHPGRNRTEKRRRVWIV